MNKKNKGFTLIELLAVIVILAIILGFGVGAYQKYLVSSRNKAYNIAEKSMKDSATSAIADCFTENGKNREFCQNHELPENQYTYELIYLKELTADEYINPIKDPYDTEKLCDENSYVYIRNKADNEVQNNADLEYKVCLICSKYKSKDCLDDIDVSSDYNTYCKVSYDETGTKPYDGKWTDQTLYLTLTVDGDYKYGINYFTYKIGSGKEIKVGANDNKVIIPLKSTVNNQVINTTANDSLGQKATTSCFDGNLIKIDKTKIISATLKGNLAKKKDEVKSNEWASEDVLLTAIPNPKSIPSGYLYQWYKDGVKIGGETTNSTYTATEDGTYYVEVTNGLHNQTVKTNEFIVKIDRTAPTIAVITNPLNLSTQDYNFIDNVTYTFGISDGKVVCDPPSSKKTGVYDVTCKAIGNNKLIASVTFKVQHSYPATPEYYSCECNCKSYSCQIPTNCRREEGQSCTCNNESFENNGSGNTYCSSYTCTPWVNNVCDYIDSTCKKCETCTCTNYKCPNGGTAQGSTCYY